LFLAGVWVRLGCGGSRFEIPGPAKYDDQFDGLMVNEMMLVSNCREMAWIRVLPFLHLGIPFNTVGTWNVPCRKSRRAKYSTDTACNLDSTRSSWTGKTSFCIRIELRRTHRTNTIG
jgi:hypothetical protein